jgi:NADH-quinone oxidoreductase subunit N
MGAWTDLVAPSLGVLGGVMALLFDAWDRRGAALWSACVMLSAGGAWAALWVGGGGWVHLAAAACLLLTAAALLGGARVLAADPAGARIVALSALAGASAAVVASTADLVMLLVAIEVLAVCGFAIVALGRGPGSRQAAMRWFVQSAVATVVLVSGIGVLFWADGGSPLLSAGVAAGAGGGVAATVGSALVLSALAFKAGSFPFHSWVPDAYTSAPPVGAAVLASAGKIGILVAIARLFPVASPGPLTAWTIAALATASIVFGNLAALRQKGLSRMLAYSAIAQVGYALVAVATASKAAVDAVVVFAIAYGIAIAGAFVLVEAVREREPEWNGTIAGLAGLGSRRVGPSVAATALLLSLTGIPVTVGFWGKLLVFGVAVSGGWTWLAVVAAVGSVVSFGYYGAVIRTVWFGGPDLASGSETKPGAPGPSTWAAVAAAIVVVMLGVTPLVTGLGGLLSVMLGRP